jgi:hypothetical protein
LISNKNSIIGGTGCGGKMLLITGFTFRVAVSIITSVSPQSSRCTEYERRAWPWAWRRIGTSSRQKTRPGRQPVSRYRLTEVRHIPACTDHTQYSNKLLNIQKIIEN